jgi:hypothetical protein
MEDDRILLLLPGRILLLLLSANGAATFQPSPKGWVKQYRTSKG